MKQIIYNKLEEHQLAGWLVFSAMRLESLADKSIFKPIGLTAATFRILMTLDSLGSQSPSDFIEILGSSKSNLTQRLTWLAKKKLITFSRHTSSDKRRSLAKITNLGRRQLEATCLLVKKNNLHIENYFDNKEAQEFLRLLRKLNQGLDQCQLHINKSI